MTNIQFRHRRVVLLQMNPEIIPFWNRHHLVIRLHIRIDLGTRERKLSEKLNELRDPLLESTYVVDGVSSERDSGSRNRSRGVSLDRALQQTNENRPPPRTLPSEAYPAHGRADRHLQRSVASHHIPKARPAPFRERVPSNLTDLSDSVLKTKPLIMELLARMLWVSIPGVHTRWILTGNFALQCAPVHRQVSRRENERAPGANASSNSLCMRLADFHLNRFVSPNAYVSVLGRDGELRSSVCERSRRPLWNWTARFYICGERRNIIVKILHHDISGDM
ncbi:hypothetical protein OSTOST_23759, partial [Ostertagia ostertagi]